MEGNLESRDYSEKTSVRERLREIEREIERREFNAKLDEFFEKYEQDQLEKTSDASEKIDTSRPTVEDIEKTLKHHPHIHRKTQSWHYDEYNAYKTAMSESTDLTSSEITDNYEVDDEKVEAWRDRRELPSIPKRLEYFEKARIEHEVNLPEEALGHRIEPEKIQETLDEYTERENFTVNELTDLTKRIYEMGDVEKDSVAYAELYDTNEPLTEDKIRDLGLEIRANRGMIERNLNEHLGLEKDSHREVRLGVTDSRIYYWNKDANPDNWLNFLANEKIYLKSTEEKYQILDEVGQHLHIRGKSDNAEYYLNNLLGQMSHLEDPPANRTRRFSRPDYFDGETFQFMGDVTGRSFEDLKEIMSHMGSKEAGRVTNLKFPNINEYRMKFVAIAESDCHIDFDDGRLSYYEKNPARREIAMGVFSEFGDFEVKEDQKDNKRVMLPMPFGSIAEGFGVPRGDKAIHNQGLSEEIINEELRVKALYPREMFPEDGCISGTTASINRHLVLCDAKKMERYGKNPLVGQEHIEFVNDNGDERDATLNYERGDVVMMSYTKLESLCKSTNHEISKSANELRGIINDNPQRLLNDEINQIMRSLGIEMGIEPRVIYYYRDSERVSVKFEACTKGVVDTVRLVMIAPPNHPDKMDTAVGIVKSRPEMTEKIGAEIKNDGLAIHPAWKDYGIQ